MENKIGGQVELHQGKEALNRNPQKGARFITTARYQSE